MPSLDVIVGINNINVTMGISSIIFAFDVDHKRLNLPESIDKSIHFQHAYRRSRRYAFAKWITFACSFYEACFKRVVILFYNIGGGVFSFLHIQQSLFRGNEGLVEWTNFSKGGPKK